MEMEKKCFACADTSVNFDRRCVPVGVGRSKFKKKVILFSAFSFFVFIFAAPHTKRQRLRRRSEWGSVEK